MATQRIVPHLWFDKEAREAAEFYTSIFPGSRVKHIGTLHGTPSGDTDIVHFELSGYEMQAISAGPIFQVNPSISFILNFDPSRDADARGSLDALWTKLAAGGKALIPLDKYDFSERYGWIQDKYGVTWQLMLTDPRGEPRPFLIPSIMFTGKNAGRAEEAIRFYTSVFQDAHQGSLARYGPDQPPNKEGTLMFADFMIEGQWFGAMDSAQEHGFELNEAISLLVRCDTQQEIDAYWRKLSAVPASEQCGWLKDKFGVSWQIVPARMDKMLMEGTPAQVDRVTQAFLPMKKMDLAALERAYREGEAVRR